MPAHGIRAVYQPFSLQERMAPLNMMKEEYDKVNEGLADLEMTTNQMTQYIDPSSQAGQALASYNKMLEDTAGTLSREGLKGVSRTALYNLRRTYQSQIAPINEGAKNYAALQAKIKEMQWKDPTIMVSGMPTFDEYIKNPNALPNLVSGTQLMKEGATAALTLPNVTYEQLSRYMQGDGSAIPDLQRSVQQIATNYGVSDERALQYIQRGIFSGLGERSTQLDMARQKADIEFDKQMRLARYNQGAQTARQNAQIAASREARNAEMLLRGYVPDGKGGYVFDENAALNAQASVTTTSKPSSRTGQGSSRTTAQYQNRTRGIIKYDGNGQVTESGNNVSLAGGTQIADITKATTEEKVAALRHAGIPIGNAQATDASGNFSGTYNKEAIDAIVDEYIDELSAYRFYSSKDRKGRLKNFWGAGTDVRRDVDGTSSSGYYNPSTYMGGSENEIPEEDQ